nr:MAG TPA_asm: hypothetical protein [Bacteriophage sp.]
MVPKILNYSKNFISAVRKKYRNLLRVVTSTHSLIIKTCHLAGFCFPAIG